MSNESWQTSARHQIESNRKQFERGARKFSECLKHGKFSEAAIFAQSIAHFAWINHCGFFSAPAIENQLLALGQQLFPAVKDEVKPRNDQRVLHVLSEAYPTGGHTRGTWRWIERDKAHQHSVAITQQPRIRKIPAPLEESVRASGGQLHNLVQETQSMFERAKKLRAISMEYDFIVLHIHPYDVLTILAFADETNLPPIILENHADHVFFIGLSVTNVLLNLREAGADLARERRGAPDTNMRTLPLPLAPMQRELSREHAKREIGFGPEAKILLSVASKYKYAPLSDTENFFHWQKQILAKNPTAQLIVIGHDGETKLDRVTLIPANPLIRKYYEAADVYLDSYPLGSPTSALEAAQFETPVVGHRYADSTAAVLLGSSPGVDGGAHRNLTPTDHAETVQKLLDDTELRQSSGLKIAKSVRSHHLGDWVENLQKIYSFAKNSSRIRLDSSHEESLSELDSLLVATHQLGGITMSFNFILFRHLIHFRPAFAWKYLVRPTVFLGSLKPTIFKLWKHLRR